jgi:amidohydrolase
MKQEMISFLLSFQNEITNLCKFLYENPEESYKEEKASRYICNLLQEHNFNIVSNYLNIPNSFYATKGSGHPKICYLCEYDAVKELGHITGHNALASISISASLALGKIIDKINGSVILIGCPGEYLGGTKSLMAKQGTFDDIDIVMECHPDINTHESGSSFAIMPLAIQFNGTSGLSHLNNNTYSSLDALLLTINNINSLIKFFPSDVKINYIISKGGYSPLVIPDKVEAQFYIRAKSSKNAELIENNLRGIAEVISKLTKIQHLSTVFETPNEELSTNNTLNRLYINNLKENGIIDISGPKNINAGLSIGIVSKKVPCIHPFISIINNKEISYGSKEFAKATTSEFAISQITKSALALACTGVDIILKEELLTEIRNEFYNKSKEEY